MMKMIITILMMTVLFLGGVLIGVNQANDGISTTRGYSTSNFEDAIKSEQREDGAYEVSIMGEDFQQVNLEQKEKDYEAIQSSHFTQKLAGNLETGVKWFYNKVIQSAYQLAQAFF